MTEDQKIKCASIIHANAVLCGAGNALPLPGVGVAADIVVLTTMTCELAAVFGADLTVEAAKGIAIGSLKKTVLKEPVKALGKELSKLIPFGGQIIASTVSVGLVEAAGWAMAKDLERRYA